MLNLNEKIKKHLPYIFQNPYRDTLPKSSDLMEYYRENQFYYRKLNELKRKCKKNNLHIYFLTLSVPHNHQKRLDSLNKILETSMNQLLKSKTFKDFENKINIKFRCLKFEVDISDKYGFNPHDHYLIIAENDLKQEELTEIELKLSTKYYNILINNKAINSQIDYWLKEEYTDDNNIKHKGHILNVQKDFNYLSYLADNSKHLEKHIQNLESKNFSVYQLPLIYSENINYDNLFLQYVDFMKSKQKKKQRSIFSLHFDFSNRYFLDIDFKYEKIKTIKKTFKDFTFQKPNLDTEIQKYEKVEDYYTYKITKDYLQSSSIFLADKLMKHYHLDELYFQSKDMSKKFKLWVNFISNLNFYAFVGYIHNEIDPDCLKKSEDIRVTIHNYENLSAKVPEIVKDLAFEYRHFYYNLRGYEEYDSLKEKTIEKPQNSYEYCPKWVETELDKLQYDVNFNYIKHDSIDDFLILRPARLIEKFKSQNP